MSVSLLKILCRYEYDPLDRLTSVGLVDHDSTQRFYQADHLTTELGQQTQRTIIRHESQPLAQQQSAAGVTEATLLATDQAHSVLQTLAQTNPQQLAYTAYGHHPADSGLSRLIGFNGECPEAITGHYLLGRGNRAFNPVLMRFNSPDNLSPFEEGGVNCYAYCQGDPVNFNDPTGNIRFKMPVPMKVVSESLGRTRKSWYEIKRTVKTNHSTRNSSLNAMRELSVTAPPPQSSTSTATSRLVNMDTRLPPTENLTNLIPDSLKQTQYFENLDYYGKVFDQAIQNNSNFRTVATVEQYKALRSHIAGRHLAQNETTKKIHKEHTAYLMLQIKSTSVNNFSASTTNQQIRSK
jgi:RHS repeat-associated protein